MDDQFWMLRGFSVFLKTMSVVSLLTSLALEGATIYVWGRFSAFYDMLSTAWKAFANTYNQFNSTGIALPAVLAPLSNWPMLVVMALILMITVIIAFTLWAGGDWIDMRITQAREEIESRDMLTKALNSITLNLTAVAGYFSSLPSPHK